MSFNTHAILLTATPSPQSTLSLSSPYNVVRVFENTYLDVEVSHVQGMQKGYPVQNLLQQSGDLPFLWNFVPVKYHL